MNKQTAYLIAAGIVATICFVAAGLLVNLGQNSAQADSAVSATHQPAEVAQPHPLAVEFFNFGDGDNARHQILLELANNAAQDYTLTTVSLDDPLHTRQIAVCTHTGVPVVSPPASVAAQKEPANAPSIWGQISAWLTSPASDSYFIALWSPNDTADAYVLVSGDGPTAPVVCSSLADEGV